MNGILPNGLPTGLIWRTVFFGSPQNENLGGSAPVTGKSTQAPPPAPAHEGATNADGSGKGAKPLGGIGGCGPETMIMLLVMVAFFYFFLIRPQQKQEKKRKALLAAVKKNDKVVTTSGIYATVVALDENTVTLKIDEKGDIRVKFDRSAVANILNRPNGDSQKK